MGGTIDGRVYELLSPEHKSELEKLTNQTLVSLTNEEARLARLLEDTDAPFNAKEFFKKSQQEDYNLEQNLINYIREKNKEINKEE